MELSEPIGAAGQMSLPNSAIDNSLERSDHRFRGYREDHLNAEAFAVVVGDRFEQADAAAIGKPLVLLVTSGRPLDLRKASAQAPAIMEIWFPGTRGGNAVAKLLFGDAVPGGKLPFNWPRSVVLSSTLPRESNEDLYLFHPLTPT